MNNRSWHPLLRSPSLSPFLGLIPTLTNAILMALTHPAKAKKKKVDVKTAEDLGVDIAPRFEMFDVQDPPVRAAGSLVADVDELLAKLRDEAKVLDPK